MVQTFSSLLSSLQNGKTGQRSGEQIQTPPAPKPAATNLKRKASDEESSARKAPKLDDSKIAQPVKTQTTTSTTSRFQLTKPGVRTTSDSPRPAAKAVGAVKSSNGVRQSSAPPTAQAVPPKSKGGFTELMAKAKAAQEAIKAKGPDTIKHKPTEKLSKRDKARQAQAAKDQQTQQRPGQKTNAGLSSISSPRANGAQPARKAPLAYKGTMGKTAVANNSRMKGKSLAQDKYGGYASWSDLDEAEDEEQYDSESDMEEAGFDDMLAEEEQSSRIARREDQEALDEENRHKREKEARKKRLMALSSAAATKKRY